MNQARPDTSRTRIALFLLAGVICVLGVENLPSADRPVALAMVAQPR